MTRRKTGGYGDPRVQVERDHSKVKTMTVSTIAKQWRHNFSASNPDIIEVQPDDTTPTQAAMYESLPGLNCDLQTGAALCVYDTATSLVADGIDPQKLDGLGEAFAVLTGLSLFQRQTTTG